MPSKGWETVTIREEYYSQLKELAEKDRRSVSNYLELKLIECGILKEILAKEVSSR